MSFFLSITKLEMSYENSDVLREVIIVKRSEIYICYVCLLNEIRS